jgi:hypothetical protein
VQRLAVAVEDASSAVSYPSVPMRRVFQTPAQKRRSARRARYELAHRQRRRKANATELRPLPKSPRAKGKPWKFRTLSAPKNFSLIDNADETLSYFRDAYEWLRDRKRVRFDLSGIERMTPDAIALLVANVNSKAFTFGRPVAGNAPDDPVARTMFEQSGFLEHVEEHNFGQRERKQLLVHRITFNKVENQEAKNAGRFASSHLFGDGRKIRPLYEVLIECMANTNNHASTSRRGFYDWWLFVYNDPAVRRTVFTFLDLGVGIFESLPMKAFWKDPLRSMGITGNLSVLPKLLGGEICSRTGRIERGKGIPRINEHATGGTFSRFVMIANDVYADLVSSSSRYLKEPFHGTLFVFEIARPANE